MLFTFPVTAHATRMIAAITIKINPRFFWKLFKIDGKEIDIASFVVTGSEYQTWKKNPAYALEAFDMEKEEDIYFC